VSTQLREFLTYFGLVAAVFTSVFLSVIGTRIVMTLAFAYGWL